MATLYVIPGSHPSMAVRRMLEAKGIPYKRRDLIPVVSKGVVRAAGFPGNTVPALKINGKKVQGTGQIARHLDQIRPEPRIVPDAGEEFAKVEEAEQWADGVLQGMARRITWNVLRRDRNPMASYSQGARLGVPVSVAVKTGQPIVAMAARVNDATDENVRRDIAELPAAIAKIDDWIADDVIGGDQPNIADYQIAPSLRLMMTMDDLAPAFEGHPAAEIAKRVIPDFPGHAPAILPAEWLEPLRGASDT